MSAFFAIVLVAYAIFVFCTAVIRAVKHKRGY